jgi:hypothetical protein
MGAILALVDARPRSNVNLMFARLKSIILPLGVLLLLPFR